MLTLGPTADAADTVGFEAFVDGLSAAAAPKCETFGEFVSALPGVPPNDALASLHRLSRYSLDAGHISRLTVDAGHDRASMFLDQGRGLPLPHPLDSEFRFDDGTAKRLADALVSATVDGEEILLIGTPTVAMALAEMTVDRRVRFVGRRDCVSKAVAAAFSPGRFVLGEDGTGSAAAALVDPPWYPESVRTMLGFCARGCRQRAVVWMVMPPVGTKPEASHDREAFLVTAERLGLHVTGGTANASYRTPLFELAAMERQGIARLASWRSGNIIELVVRGAPAPADAVSARDACELTIGGIRFRLAVSIRTGPPLLTPVADDEVFPSVSSRAPGRLLANLWTSGNRAFKVDAQAARRAMAELGLLAGQVLQGRLTVNKNDLDRLASIASSNQLIHQLIELLGRELNDARRLVGDGAWLETVTEWRS